MEFFAKLYRVCYLLYNMNYYQDGKILNVDWIVGTHNFKILRPTIRGVRHLKPIQSRSSSQSMQMESIFAICVIRYAHGIVFKSVAESKQ